MSGRWVVIILGALHLGGCGGSEPPEASPPEDEPGPDTGEVEVPEDSGEPDDTGEADDTGEEVLPTLDVAALLAVKAQYDPYVSDLALLATEQIEDEDGCLVHRWQFSEIAWYAYTGYPHPTTFGAGMRLVDVGETLFEAEEDRPRHIFLQVDEQGHFLPAGLGWFRGLPSAQPWVPHPELFGLPMVGVNDPEYPDQGYHYYLRAWLWITSPHNEYGYLGWYNDGMEPPSWYPEFIVPLLPLHEFREPGHAEDLGYVSAGSCRTGGEGDLGHPLVREDLVGVLDPEAPDTVLTDASGELLGLQWTYPDDGTGPPVMFQQPFAGPDADGNYVLRAWIGKRFNHGGHFHPEHLAFSCSELPPSCP